MARGRCTDVQACPAEFLDVTSYDRRLRAYYLYLYYIKYYIHSRRREGVDDGSAPLSRGIESDTEGVPHGPAD